MGGTKPRNTTAHRLTDAAIRKAIATGQPEFVPDGAGLYLRIRNGRGRWYIRQTMAIGGRTWVPLFEAGDYPDTSLKAARDAAAEARKSRVITHADLATQRRQAAKEREDRELREYEAARRVLTFAQVFEQWTSTDLQPRPSGRGKASGRKDGGYEVKQRFKRHVLPQIGDRLLTEVTRADLMAVLDRTRGLGLQRTTGDLLQELGQMLRWAVNRELIPRNPLDGLRKGDVGAEDVERTRVLSDDEIGVLARALPTSGMSERGQAGVLLMLATGARVGEIEGACWPDAGVPVDQLRALAERAGVKYGVVDIAAAHWYLPDTKNRRDHRIHLSDFALDQVRKLAEIRRRAKAADAAKGRPADPRPWLFRERQGAGPVVAFGKQISDRQVTGARKVQANRAGDSTSLALPGGPWTAHDLRRTAATLMSRLGFHGEVIDACLNHAETNKVRRIYIQDRREAEQARAFDALGKRLAELTCEPAAAQAEAENAPTLIPALRIGGLRLVNAP